MKSSIPKFFIPAAEDKQQEQTVYESIKEFLSDKLGARFDNRQIFQLDYVHNGRKYNAEVGQKHELNGEIVIAILHDQSRRLYHVCTPNRGVFRDMSILVGEHNARFCRDFSN